MFVCSAGEPVGAGAVLCLFAVLENLSVLDLFCVCL